MNNYKELFDDKDLDFYVHRLGVTAKLAVEPANAMERFYMTGNYSRLDMDPEDCYIDMLSYLGPHAMKVSLFPDLIAPEEAMFSVDGFEIDRSLEATTRREADLRLVVDACLVIGVYPSNFSFSQDVRDNAELLMDYLKENPTYTKEVYVAELGALQVDYTEVITAHTSVRVHTGLDFQQTRSDVLTHLELGNNYRYYRMGDKAKITLDTEEKYLALDVIALLRQLHRTEIVLTPSTMVCRDYLISRGITVFLYQPGSFKDYDKVLFSGFDKISDARYQSFFYVDVLHMESECSYFPSMMYHRGVVVSGFSIFQAFSKRTLLSRAFWLMDCLSHSAFEPFSSASDSCSTYFQGISFSAPRHERTDRAMVRWRDLGYENPDYYRSIRPKSLRREFAVNLPVPSAPRMSLSSCFYHVSRLEMERDRLVSLTSLWKVDPGRDVFLSEVKLIESRPRCAPGVACPGKSDDIVTVLPISETNAGIPRVARLRMDRDSEGRLVTKYFDGDLSRPYWPEPDKTQNSYLKDVSTFNFSK